jgi:hypothetical protein
MKKARRQGDGEPSTQQMHALGFGGKERARPALAQGKRIDFTLCDNERSIGDALEGA